MSPSNSYIEALNSKVVQLKDRALGLGLDEIIRVGFSKEINTLIRKDTKELACSPSPCIHQEEAKLAHRERMVAHKPEEETSE